MPVAKPICCNMRATSSVATLPVAPGAKGQPHTTIEGAGHFLQEDKGEDVAQAMIDFMRAYPVG